MNIGYILYDLGTVLITLEAVVENILQAVFCPLSPE